MRRSSKPFGSRLVGNGILATILLGIALALAGCASAPRAIVAPSLPPMPSRIAAPCSDPGVAAGQPYILVLARTRQALAACEGKRRDGVAFYEELRRRLAK